MNDDVKAAADSALVESMLRQLRGSVSVGDEMTLDHACLIDDVEAWIAGEPARIAAAVAAAREEQRASDAEHLARIWYGLPDAGRADHGPVAVVRATPLTATPLADEIAALRARVAELEHQREGMLMGGVTTEARQQLERAEKAEAERDALRARVFEVEQRQVGYVLVSFASHEQWKAELAELSALRARFDALYGVILFAHAFAEAEPLVSGYVRLHGYILHLREIHALARAAVESAK